MNDFKLFKAVIFALASCLIFASHLFSVEKKVLPEKQMRNLVVSSDHILQGAISDIKKETHGLKRIYTAKLKVTDCFSTTLKVGDIITVTWESHPLKQVAHQYSKGIQGIWFLRKEGHLYSANLSERFLSMAYFEQVFNEIDKMGTRVYINKPIMYLSDEKKIILIIRNIEDEDLKMPMVKLEGNNIQFHPNFSFKVVPISSFSQKRTILSKNPLKPSKGEIMIKAIETKDLKSPEHEIRVEFDLEQFYKFPKKGFYAIIFDRKGYPGQLIAAVEIKKRLKLKVKYDFRLMANDKFAADSIKHTVNVLKSIVKEQDTQKAFLKLRKLNTLHLEGKKIVNLLPLASFSQIEYLELSDNKIENLLPLKQLKGLKYLSVDNNELKNLKGLEFLFDIEFLSANDCNLEDISSLANLKKMYYFSASNNLIDDLSVFKKLIRIQVLSLQNNIIKNIRSLSQVLALRRLNLKNNSIKVLDALVYANNLEYLNILNNPIAYNVHLDPLIEKHKNDFGRMIKLIIVQNENLNKPSSANEKKNDLLPEMDDNYTSKVEIKEKSEETFQEQIARAGIKVDLRLSTIGKVINVSKEKALLVIQYSKKIGLPVKDDHVIIYRNKDYIGKCKIIAVEGNKVVGKVISELKNDRKLNFKINDSVRFQED
ncbi:MAG: hypothetical protein COA79_18655 [Planctomycetota bacterium]|nr:MAG: hypothetical protein COA79_18655 [Planctomycetota bacterium]